MSGDVLRPSIRTREVDEARIWGEMRKMRSRTRRDWPRYHEVIDRHIESGKGISIVAEVGTAHGIWGRHMLDHYQDRIELYFGVDVWERGHAPINDRKDRSRFDVISRMWMANMQPWIWRKAIPLRGTSHEWGRVFPHEIDLLHIDGGHEYETVIKDFELWVPLVADGGLILVDDVTHPDVTRSLNEYFGSWSSFPNSNVEGDDARCAFVRREK